MNYDQELRKLQQEREGVQAGDVARLTSPWKWGMLPAGSLAIIGGMRGAARFRGSLTFNANGQAFRDDRYVSCSGGPATICTDYHNMKATGEIHRQQFWRWRDGMPQAHNGETYYMDVAVWEIGGDQLGCESCKSPMAECGLVQALE